MPIYVYRCEECKHELEILQKMDDEPLVFCPQCNEPKLKRIPAAGSFRLKGDGWYDKDKT